MNVTKYFDSQINSTPVDQETMTLFYIIDNHDPNHITVVKYAHQRDQKIMIEGLNFLRFSTDCASIPVFERK